MTKISSHDANTVACSLLTVQRMNLHVILACTARLLILAFLNSARAGSKSAQDSSFWIWLVLYLDLGSFPLSPSSDSVHLA